jgi:hypothetical protein
MHARPFSVFIVFFLFLSSLGGAYAQNPLAKRFPKDDFWSSLSVAKILDPKSGEVAVRIPSWNATTVTEVITETASTFETRQRTKRVGNEEVVETYTVEVPVTVQRAVDRTEYSANEPLKTTVSLAKVKAWTASGTLVSAEQLKARLSKSVYFFAMEKEPEPGETPIDTFFASALSENVLFVFSDELNQQMAAAVKWAESQPPAPAAPVAPAGPSPVADPNG